MLSSTGEIYISGYNGYGQLGEGESTSNITIAKKQKYGPSKKYRHKHKP